MTLLDNHLEQIVLSGNAIAGLRFPPPKVFTNALLGDHEITNLIRDTEPHERALFALDPNAANGKPSRQSARRGTLFDGKEKSFQGRKSMYMPQEPGKQSAIARVLGGDMLREIQQSNRGASQRGAAGKGVNIEILLQGAEKLCMVYPVAGAPEKITLLRSRHRQISESVASYEQRVIKQQSKLDRVNRGASFDVGDLPDEGEDAPSHKDEFKVAITNSDLQMEEQEIKDLEAKKRALEERVAGMEKDLGGLMQ